MLAGASHQDFTPAPGPVLQGHYSTNPSTAVLHPIEARAAAFHAGERTVVVITLDVLGVSLDTTARVRARLQRALNIHPNNVMLCASHTHCAPPTLDNLLGTPDPAFLAAVEDAAVQCATKAVSDLRPVQLAVGCSAAYFNVNRRPFCGTTAMAVNHGAACDKRVRTLQAVDPRGRAVATLFHYTCHPTALRGSDGLISPDYPGVARAAVEHDTGAPALFLPGTFGNIRPAILTPKGGFASATPDQLQQIGAELAGSVLRAARHSKPLDADLLDARQTDLTLPFAPGPSDEELRAIELDATPAVAVKHPWAHSLLSQRAARTVPVSERSVMQLLRIGPVTLLSIPGEPVQEIGLSLERIAHPRHPELWPVGYTNDMLGYLVTERHKLEGGYEPNAYPYFTRPAPFADEQSLIEQAAAKLLGI
jgi:hypothetical protein